MKASRGYEVRNLEQVQLIAKLADMLEFASWDYSHHALEAKKIVSEADDYLEYWKKPEVKS